MFLPVTNWLLGNFAVKDKIMKNKRRTFKKKEKNETEEMNNKIQKTLLWHTKYLNTLKYVQIHSDTLQITDFTL